MFASLSMSVHAQPANACAHASTAEGELPFDGTERLSTQLSA
jgi:hypothetical protein